MTEQTDICGADTTGKEPCRNPAGENGRCWIPSHQPDAGEDVQNPHGRPSKLDEYEDDIIEAAREGLTYEGIARVAGIGLSTLNDWRDQYDDFSAALERARSHAERELIQDVDPEFVLERSYDYVKTEKREVELDADVDGSHDVTADFVTYRPEDEEEEDDE
jgi:transposase-like protein